MSPQDIAERSEILSNLLFRLSFEYVIDDKLLAEMAQDVELLYSDGYRQQYSDLMNTLVEIRNRPELEFDDQNLCNNLERLSDFIRSSLEDDGSTYSYSMDAFLGITKLTDHIILEVQRDRDYITLMHNVRMAERNAHTESEILSEEIDKAKRMVKKARKEAQGSKVELVAILSIFAALVIAFSGGLTYLGGTISSSSDVSIGTTVFSVLICGLMLFNIIAFLMVMILVIVRLNKGEDEPIVSRSMAVSLILTISVFDTVLLLAIWMIIDQGLVSI